MKCSSRLLYRAHHHKLVSQPVWMPKSQSRFWVSCKELRLNQPSSKCYRIVRYSQRLRVSGTRSSKEDDDQDDDQVEIVMSEIHDHLSKAILTLARSSIKKSLYFITSQAREEYCKRDGKTETSIILSSNRLKQTETHFTLCEVEFEHEKKKIYKLVLCAEDLGKNIISLEKLLSRNQIGSWTSIIIFQQNALGIHVLERKLKQLWPTKSGPKVYAGYFNSISADLSDWRDQNQQGDDLPLKIEQDLLATENGTYLYAFSAHVSSNFDSNSQRSSPGEKRHRHIPLAIDQIWRANQNSLISAFQNSKLVSKQEFEQAQIKRTLGLVGIYVTLQGLEILPAKTIPDYGRIMETVILLVNQTSSTIRGLPEFRTYPIENLATVLNTQYSLLWSLQIMKSMKFKQLECLTWNQFDSRIVEQPVFQTFNVLASTKSRSKYTEKSFLRLISDSVVKYSQMEGQRKRSTLIQPNLNLFTILVKTLAQNETDVYKDTLYKEYKFDNLFDHNYVEDLLSRQQTSQSNPYPLYERV
ncbi:uncharacterized protein V1516DRAFT_315693 [Lipomyces oligophaga]|uniref:uncharacterized protein n=1 Tax=Lipomyces oligophaga TaxID=45792 RepID=UPI0034CFC9B5